MSRPTKAGFQDRVEMYRVLTRVKGLPRKAAVRRLGVECGESWRYEDALTGMTGAQRREARGAKFRALRAQGLSRAAAARQAGVNYMATYRWEPAASKAGGS